MSNVETIKVVPARYPLRAAGAVVALFVLAVVIQSVAFNPRWEWAVFARWFFDPVILEGVGQTLLLTLISTVLSVVIGGMLALARLSSSWLLSSLAWGYIWLFRSLPLIVVLIILYNFSYLYDTLSLGVPFTGITWGSFETINVLGQFSTAIVGLTLVQSAYTAEIIRGGFLGVDHGQYEAAAALGLGIGKVVDTGLGLIGVDVGTQPSEAAQTLGRGIGMIIETGVNAASSIFNSLFRRG